MSKMSKKIIMNEKVENPPSSNSVAPSSPVPYVEVPQSAVPPPNLVSNDFLQSNFSGPQALPPAYEEINVPIIL
jgi:hypothetical protein